MNIQESIEILKELKKNEWGELENCSAYAIQAIETLLTAYEKEKEKNKEFKNQLNTIKDIYYNTNDLEELSDVLGVLLSNLKEE